MSNIRPNALGRALRGFFTDDLPQVNVRLAAVHAFVRYAAQHHPEHLELCQQILAVPFKRAPQNVVEYLEADELQALLEAPDCTTRDGRRDRTLLLTMIHVSNIDNRQIIGVGGHRAVLWPTVRQGSLGFLQVRSRQPVPLRVQLGAPIRTQRMVLVWSPSLPVALLLCLRSGNLPSGSHKSQRKKLEPELAEGESPRSNECQRLPRPLRLVRL